ncbi:MAG: phenylacetaldoxime dehydratase family protein [Steroidobacteraceae bacterium]
MSVESAIPPHLICARTLPSRMPAGFEAPYPAWMARYQLGAPPLVMAYFGAQQLALLPPDALAPIKAMLPAEPAPPYWLEAQSHDSAGFDTRVLIAYWHNSQRFAAWRRTSGFDAWWADPARESEPLGRFLEVVTPPMERLEVAYSPPHRPEGAGNLQSRVSTCPVAEHAYWGSARDRIPASQTDRLDGGAKTLTTTRHGARVRIAPGANVCMIRSGQDWSETTDDERQIYLGRVRPKLIEGMTYLRDQGLPIGCFSCRFMQVLDPSGAPTERSFGQAYFDSLAALEHWAEHHPTHLAIFGTFMQTMAPLGDAMKLRLWHEVMVLPEDAQSFEYVNCHSRTGLLAAAAS